MLTENVISLFGTVKMTICKSSVHCVELPHFSETHPLVWSWLSAFNIHSLDSYIMGPFIYLNRSYDSYLQIIFHFNEKSNKQTNISYLWTSQFLNNTQTAPDISLVPISYLNSNRVLSWPYSLVLCIWRCTIRRKISENDVLENLF